MDYYFSTLLKTDFDAAIARVKKELETEGFGIVTNLDMQKKFREKLGTEFKKYTILGACNAEYAFKALRAEEKIGTMLPCNILVIDKEDGTVEIATVNPLASMAAVDNKQLTSLALDISNKLKRVIGNI